MTIAISLKVNDGLVLAADSASTLIAQTPGGPEVVQVFNHANKVLNLRKGLPIGLIMWGAGAIGRAAISTLIKDLRLRFTGADSRHAGREHGDWRIEPEAYSIAEVAKLVRRFVFEEHYLRAFEGWPQKPPLGLIVAGYSSGGDLAEEYRIEISDEGECGEPVEVRPREQCGATWNGQPEAISRLVLGYSPGLGDVLVELGVKPERIPGVMEVITRSLRAQIIYDAMPIQDAIDLAEFLADLSARFSRYTPGAVTVGGPIEIAAITKHEGFKWIQRKLYFSEEFNPEVER